MKKNRVIQFSLVIAIIILFFTTYYSGDKDDICILLWRWELNEKK